MSSPTSTPESPPIDTSWLGTRRHGQWWNYSVLQDETRAELYIDDPIAADSKTLFDILHAQRAAGRSGVRRSPHLAAPRRQARLPH